MPGNLDFKAGNHHDGNRFVKLEVKPCRDGDQVLVLSEQHSQRHSAGILDDGKVESDAAHIFRGRFERFEEVVHLTADVIAQQSDNLRLNSFVVDGASAGYQARPVT